jgi:histidyl-tRNA synthetase
LSVQQEALAKLGLSETQVERIGQLVTLDFAGYLEINTKETLAHSNVARIIKEELIEVPILFDPLIIRGFEYYTSTVFEVFDTSPDNRRALFGGGRYDNLVALFSNKRIPGIGFGMGDVTLFDFLETHGLLPQPGSKADVCVMPLHASVRTTMKQVANELRAQGIRAVIPLEEHNLSKEIRDSARRGIRLAVILGEEELARQQVIVRDLTRSEQVEVPRSELVATIKKKLLES